MSAVLELLKEVRAAAVVAREAVELGKRAAAHSALRDLERLIAQEQARAASPSEEQTCRLHPGLHRVDRRIAGLVYLGCGCHQVDGYRGEGTA